jgi:uncharacterized damage-inducible protein DinB
MAAKKKKAKGKAPAKKQPARPRKAAPRKAARSSAKAPAAPNPWRAFADRFAQEAATTLKVMRAFPADQGAFQPHPRSSTAHRLMATFAIEQAMTLAAIKGTLQMPPQVPPPPATLADCVAAFEKAAADVVAAARAASPASYTRMVPFFGGPQQIAHVPAGAVAEMMLGDQIHHRGQLSVYLRMAGGKVPSIYGPSADEPW